MKTPNRPLCALLLLPLIASACKPRLSGHERQAIPVELALLEQTATLCDDLGFKVELEWEMEVSRMRDFDYQKSDRIGKELAQREGRKVGAKIALLDRETESMVRRLEEKTDPAAGLAREAYLASRNFCATIAYPDVYKPEHLKGQMEQRRATRNDAWRKLGTGAPPLDAAGRADLSRVEGLVATIPTQPEPARRPAPDLARQDPSPDFERDTRVLSLTELHFREGKSEMRIEGSVANLGTAPLDGVVAVVSVGWSNFESDPSQLLRTERIPIESKHLAPHDNAKFSWVFATISAARRCRVRFEDGRGQAIETVGSVLLSADANSDK